ncbi:unnamed protein product [Taenia asiatica]|uniref:GOLGA2L5 domain-containing protein n=1 Tax=Taenia asiatica TaxID=60517 RepID=A0A0R3VTH1_TAEAS|nr:unnamed protein product [Taenia asiatica]
MGDSYRFTTLERSLNTLGVNIGVTGTRNSESKRKRNKKRSQKTKVATITTSDDCVAVEVAETTDEGWIAVASKKSKVTSSSKDVNNDAPAAVAITPTSTVPPSPQPNQLSESANSSAKKKRRRSEKNKVSESSTKASEVSPITSPTPQESMAKNPLQETPQLPETASSQCSASKTPKDSEKADSFSYAYRLEYLVSEALGQEAVIKARANFPNLIFSQPPPAVTTPSDPERDLCWSDFIQMKATLRAKEVECNVLREEVIRLYPLVNGESRGSPSMTTGSPQKPSAEMSKQQQKKLSVPTASKDVQCEIEAPAPPEVEPASSPNSIEAKVILSLQGEIARLARENTVLTQRQTNLEGRLENAKRQTSKLQFEMRKATSAASKEAEAVVRQQMDEMVKKLQVAATEKEEILSMKTTQLELVEQKKDEALQLLQKIQAEHSKLMEAKRVEELHLADTMKALENMQAERDEAKKEQTLLDQNLKLARSSLEAELDGLRQRLAHLKTSLDQSTHLKEELASTKSELAATKMAMAEVTAKYDHDISDATEARLKDALDRCTHPKEELASTQDELVATKMEVTELTEKHAREMSALKAQTVELVAKNEESLESPAPAELKSSMSKEVCGNCAHLSAEVVRYQEIIASTEDALSHLQRSVRQEEERWRLALQKCCEENTQLKARLGQLVSQSEDSKCLISSFLMSDQAVFGNKKNLDSEVSFPKMIKNGDNNSNGFDFSPSVVENGGFDQEVDA